MNKSFMTCMLVVTFLAACAAENSGNKTKVRTNANGGAGSQGAAGALKAGTIGESAAIEVYGQAVVVDSNNKTALDARITVVTAPGGRAVTPKLGGQVNDGDIQPPVIDAKNYINAGACTLDKNDTDGLTELKVDAVTPTYTATKIFMCGNQINFKTSSVLIFADEVILRNATITSIGSLGVFQIKTNKLTIDGTNSIVTKSNDESGKIPSRPLSINISVIKDLTGTGKLTLSTQPGKVLGKGTGTDTAAAAAKKGTDPKAAPSTGSQDLGGSNGVNVDGVPSNKPYEPYEKDYPTQQAEPKACTGDECAANNPVG